MIDSTGAALKFGTTLFVPTLVEPWEYVEQADSESLDSAIDLRFVSKSVRIDMSRICTIVLALMLLCIGQGVASAQAQDGDEGGRHAELLAALRHPALPRISIPKIKLPDIDFDLPESNFRLTGLLSNH